MTFNANYNRVADNSASMVAVYHVDLKGRKRYIRVAVTPDTSAHGAVISSVMSMLDLELSNVSNTSNGDIVVVG